MILSRLPLLVSLALALTLFVLLALMRGEMVTVEGPLL
jgi:hypothetical protein